MESKRQWVSVGKRGMVAVRGEDRVELLHRLSTRNLKPLNESGRVEWTVFTTNQGKMVDWVAIVSFENELILRVSEGRDEQMLEWLKRYIIMEDVQVEVVTEQWADLIAEGPGVGEALQVSEPLAADRWMALGGAAAFSGLSAYENRVEVLAPAGEKQLLIEQLRAAGVSSAEPEDVEKARLLAGVPSSSFEYLGPINPLELRLVASSISWNKGCYIGQEVISRLDSYDKVARMLIGLEGPVGLGVEPGHRIELDGKRVGKVTSWMESTGLGMAIVERAACGPGSCELRLDETSHTLERVERPFWKS